MALQACHSICIWYGLTGVTLFMVWPGGHGMVFGMAWESMMWYMVLPGSTWHEIWYGLAGMAWYMLWSE